MRRKSVLYVLSGLLFFGGVELYAQPSLPAKAEVFLPNALFDSVLDYDKVAALAESHDYGQSGTRPAELKYWEVYSDREDNVTYMDPEGTEPCGMLEFNEKVRIAKVEGRYALVYKDAIGKYPEISKYAVCRGWVPMDNLLLWGSCPADDKGVYYKALICYNMDIRTDISKMGGYLSPSMKGRSFPLTTDLRFYFIMKRVNGMALLAQEYTLDGDSSKMLYAWVPEGAFVPWNQRSCLEPTWEKEDVDHFASMSPNLPVCIEKGDISTKVSSIRFEHKDGGESDRYFYRMSPAQLRYPILDGTDGVYYECSSFGTPSGNYEMTVGGDKEVVSETTLKQEELDKLSKLNLVIAIDGTTSMEPYFQSVRDAILKGCEFFSARNYTIKVGAVIYRDYADGDGICEIYPMSSPDDQGLHSFFNTGGKYGIRSSTADKTHTEAVYYGINEAMKLFRSAEESNIMLVVGDCGNAKDDTRITKEQIIKNLVDKNVNFMGFQVRNKNIMDWNLFNSQLAMIMKSSVQGKFDALVKGNKVSIKVSSEGYVLDNEAGSNLFVGAHKYAVAGSELSPERLEYLMTESISYCAEAIQRQKDLIVTYNPMRGASKVMDAVSMQIDSAFFHKKLGDKIKAISGNTLISFRGWVDKRDDAGRDYFKPVIFISDKEFQSLLERLAPVNDAAVAKSDNREPYINAMKALVKSLVPDITDEELARQGIDKTMKLVAGLNEASSSLKDYTLLEIGSRDMVPAKTYISLINNFKRKYSGLERIKKERYKYTREFNGAKYYWIPIENLP